MRFLFVALLLALASARRPPVKSLLPPHSRTRYRSVLESWRPVDLPTASDPTIRPTDFGADPTGRTDSTQALLKTIQALITSNTSSHRMADGIVDLGGATVDLGGGDYLISQPLVVPGFYGNYRFVDGAFRASTSFPASRYLIEIGTETQCGGGQGSCSQDVGFAGLMLDASQVAAGGIAIAAVMGANIGPQMFFSNFTTAGIMISGGHEVMVHETWLGEFEWSDRRKENGTASTAIGIVINGNDHYVTNTIVFSSHVGVQVNGAANILTGVHTWNLATANGGTGIEVNAYQNRFDGCYLDFNNLVITDLTTQTVLDGFFLGGGHIVLAPSHSQPADGVYIAGNEIAGSQYDVEVVETQGQVTGAVDVFVGGSVGAPATRSVRATRTVTATQPVSSFQVDFADALLFNVSRVPIQSVQYSLTVVGSGNFVRHVARPAQGSVVTIETDAAVVGSVTVTADQGVYH